MNTALSFCCITISNKKKNSGKKEIKSLEALIPLPLLSFLSPTIHFKMFQSFCVAGGDYIGARGNRLFD